MTAYALYGLLEARAASIEVPSSALQSGTSALARQLVETPAMVPELKAYAAYVIARAAAADMKPEQDGFDAAALVTELWGRRTDMSPYGQAWLLLALHTSKDARAGELAGILATRAQTRGDLAWWTSENDPLLGDWGDATADATAAVVQALAAVRPNDPLIDPAVRWLMANRADGMSWASTKQTAMVLYGLLGAMQGRQERPAPVTVTVSSGGQSQSVAFTPEDWTRPFPAVVTLPAAAGKNAVTITSAGGPVYWTASARYYDTAEGLERTGTRKLALSRKYFTLAPVRRNGRVVYDERPYTRHGQPGRPDPRATGRRRVQRLALPDDRRSHSRRHRGRHSPRPARTREAAQLDLRLAPRVPRRSGRALPRRNAGPRRVRVPAAGDDAGTVPRHARAGHADVRAGRARLERGAVARRAEPAGAADDCRP